MPNVTDTLTTVNNILTLATTGEGVVVPLVKGIVQSFRELRNDQNEVMDYEVVLKVTASDLAEADAKWQEVIDKGNAELERLGKPKV